MSYILQALARSEKERKQQDQPNLEEAFAGETPHGSSSPANWIIVFASVVVTAVVAVGIFYLFGMNQDNQSNTVAQVPVPISSPVEKQVETPVDEKPVQSTPASKPASPVENTIKEESVSTAQTSSETQIPKPDAVFEPTASPEVSQLTIVEPPVEPVNSLPGIELNIHIYSDDPSKRSVYINGRRLSEGDRIKENNGLIHEVTPDGVIIDLGERRVLLNRIR